MKRSELHEKHRKEGVARALLDPIKKNNMMRALLEQANNQLGSKNPMWKGGRPACLDCSKRLVNYAAKRCHSCNARFLRTGKTGSLAHNWRGGITDSDKLERSKFRRIMQKQIFERDDYTCQMCDARGVSLQVDHIQSWSEYVELRFSMDNCRTLCSKCHYLITFGKSMPKEVKAWGHNLLKKEVDRKITRNTY